MSEGSRKRLEVRSETDEKFLPAMPVRVVYYPPEVTVTSQHIGDEIAFSVRTSGMFNGRTEVSAYALRTEFLNVQSPAEVMDFLLLCGPFRYGGEYDGESEFGPCSYSPVTWSEFQGWQELVRIKMRRRVIRRKMLQDGLNWIEAMEFDLPDHLNALLKPSDPEARKLIEGWPDGILFSFHQPTWDPAREIGAVIMVVSALDAIYAACYIDTLIGAHHVLCAGKDCNNLFQITSNHAREYCSQACAHKASVRRRRAAAKAAQAAKVEKPKKGRKDA